MAFKRSAVRSRLSPPKRPEIERFQVFFRLKSVVFIHSVAFIQEVAEHLLSAELYVPEFVPELQWHTLDRASHHPTLGNWMTLQELPSGSSGPLWPVGKAFDLTPIAGGNLYKTMDGRLVYGMRLKTYFGLQLANTDYVSAIVNCDITNDTANARTFPTAMMIDDMLADARAGQNTFIFCHPKVKSYLGTTCRLDHYSITNNGISTVIDAWNGVPIITSFNFDNGTESNISL